MTRPDRPTTCHYCDGTGRLPDEGDSECGFCDGGEPLDSQADWDRTWGRSYCMVHDEGKFGHRLGCTCPRGNV